MSDRTPYSSENQHFTDMAHACAAKTVYPAFFYRQNQITIAKVKNQPADLTAGEFNRGE